MQQSVASCADSWSVLDCCLRLSRTPPWPRRVRISSCWGTALSARDQIFDVRPPGLFSRCRSPLRLVRGAGLAGSLLKAPCSGLHLPPSPASPAWRWPSSPPRPLQASARGRSQPRRTGHSVVFQARGRRLGASCMARTPRHASGGGR